MADISLVVRDGNNSPTFYFSVWGHPTIPCVSLEEYSASCRRLKSREPRNEYDRFAVAVLDDETMRGESLVFLGRSGPLFVRFVGGSALGFHDIGSGASFGSLLQ